MQSLIEEFMAQKSFAVIGATDNTGKYGYKIFQSLKSRGYKVYPINPRLREIEGTRCYSKLACIPAQVDVVDFVVPPSVTEAVLKECEDLGITRVWLQPGSESEAAIDFCHRRNIKVLYNLCVIIDGV
ncbi:MAG: CoA-binding protein [Dehalococcoidales bacterium]|nr:CoA-binding protein [Dehalococcoidales bacterium]